MRTANIARPQRPPSRPAHHDVYNLNERIAVAARAADVAALNDCPDARSLANYTACYICERGDFSGDLVRGCECRAEGHVHLSCLVHRAKVAIDDITVLDNGFVLRVLWGQQRREVDQVESQNFVAFVANAMRRHWTVCEYCCWTTHQSWRWER